MTVKSIQEAKWEVYVEKHTLYPYWVFLVATKDDIGISHKHECFVGDINSRFRNKEEAQASWEAFAERNGIKNWEYV